MSARILIIEDNPANIELMVYLLGASGYTTLAALDGEEGLKIACRDLPDLIICDVQMPKMNGYEVAQQAKSNAALRDIPLVAVTAFAMVGDREKALAAGFNGYLAKPIDPETFVQQVEAFLRPELRRAAPAPISPSIESISKPQPTKGRTILVVDNLQANLDLSSSLFGYSGYSVVTARDAEEALRLARQAPPDLILSDVGMPVGSGYDLIKKVKSDPRLRSIPFVFITSTFADEQSRQKGLALGAAKFLFRPIESQALLAEIQACLRETKDI